MWNDHKEHIGEWGSEARTRGKPTIAVLPSQLPFGPLRLSPVGDLWGIVQNIPLRYHLRAGELGYLFIYR